MVTAEEAGFYKPHPKAYSRICSSLGIDASDVLFVAGSSADVLGAAAAGMQVVWHNRVNLPARPGSTPLREGWTLDEALRGFIGYTGMESSEISTRRCISTGRDLPETAFACTKRLELSMPDSVRI